MCIDSHKQIVLLIDAYRQPRSPRASSLYFNGLSFHFPFCQHVSSISFWLLLTSWHFLPTSSGPGKNLLGPESPSSHLQPSYDCVQALTQVRPGSRETPCLHCCYLETASAQNSPSSDEHVHDFQSKGSYGLFILIWDLCLSQAAVFPSLLFTLVLHLQRTAMSVLSLGVPLLEKPDLPSLVS